MLSPAVYLPHQAVVVELRWRGIFCFRKRFLQKIENPLNPRLGYHEVSSKPRLGIKFVGFVEHFGIVLSGVSGKYLHGDTLVFVVALDARAKRAQQGNQTAFPLIQAAALDNDTDVLVGHVQQIDPGTRASAIKLKSRRRTRESA